VILFLFEATIVELTEKEIHLSGVDPSNEWRSIKKIIEPYYTMMTRKIKPFLLLCTIFRNAVASMMLWWT